MSLRAAILIAIACVAGGCGGSEDPAQGAAEPQAAPRRETVFDPLTGTIDRAEGYERAAERYRADANELRVQLERIRRFLGEAPAIATDVEPVTVHGSPD